METDTRPGTGYTESWARKGLCKASIGLQRKHQALPASHMPTPRRHEARTKKASAHTWKLPSITTHYVESFSWSVAASCAPRKTMTLHPLTVKILQKKKILRVSCVARLKPSAVSARIEPVNHYLRDATYMPINSSLTRIQHCQQKQHAELSLDLGQNRTPHFCNQNACWNTKTGPI